MGKFAWSYAQLLPAVALLISLLSGLALTLTLKTQLDSLANNQGEQLTQNLAYQLARAVRDPLIHRDNLSLQVELDELLTLEGVHRAAIYDVNDRLIAQAQRDQTRDPGEYRHSSPVDIENARVGRAEVSLVPGFVATHYRKPFLLTLVIWGLFTALLIFVAYRLGHSLSSRIGNLSQHLPREDGDEGRDELTTLERRMEPLLRTPDDDRATLAEQPAALLGIACRNLPRLEALVNREHFESLMKRFDQLVARTLQLYGGHRLPGEHYNVYIEFLGADSEDDQTMNAAYCAAALLKLSGGLLEDQGVSMELAAAIHPCTNKPTGSILLDEQDLALNLNALGELLDKAASGEILLNRATSQHPSIVEFNVSPLAEGSAFCRINDFGEDGENLLSRQIALLSQH